jgi:hypothetical protein
MKIILYFLLLFCLACKNDTEQTPETTKKEVATDTLFDKEKWKVKDGYSYAYRDKMLHDLVYNVPLKGLKKSEVLELLGLPNRINNNYLFYIIDEKRAFFFPLHVRTLVIKLDKANTVEWRKIHN